MAYWLMKTEPDVFSIDDLFNCPEQTDRWEVIRNYQARNMLRDDIKLGDKVFIYHSSCAVPGIAGIAEVVREAYPDDSAFDEHSPYYDPKSSPDNPRWWQVDVKFVKKLERLMPLTELKMIEGLQEMRLLKKGNRLSIMPVAEDEWRVILKGLW